MAPHRCPAEVLYSTGLDWRPKRAATLAEGAERCGFRFKKGGETRVAVPEPLEQVVTTLSL